MTKPLTPAEAKARFSEVLHLLRYHTHAPKGSTSLENCGEGCPQWDAVRSAAEAWARASRNEMHVAHCSCHSERDSTECDEADDFEEHHAHPFVDPSCLEAREPQP